MSVHVHWGLCRAFGVCGGPLVSVAVHWCLWRSIGVCGGPLVSVQVHWCLYRSIGAGFRQYRDTQGLFTLGNQSVATLSGRGLLC